MERILARCLLLTGTLLLAGCATVRDGLGAYQSAADKGIVVNVGGEEVDKTATDAPQLPTTLGGDTEHRAWSSPQPAVPPASAPPPKF